MEQIIEIDINETEEVMQTDAKSLKLYLLNLDYASDKFYAFAPEELEVKRGDFAVVPTKYGVDLARVCGEVSNNALTSNEDIVEIIRLANEDDLLIVNDNKLKEKEAGEVFKEKVKENKLNMKFILAHFLLEEAKVLFFFSADGRVDFRALVKDLVAVFKVRVELRQIGVRDETRFVGGLASCGRPFCCNSITDKMTGVTIKMAKEQDLSLNSSRISGHCGRLLCCLSYEHEYYTTENKKTPQVGSKVYYDENLFTVKEMNHITNTISLIDADGRMINLPYTRFKKTGDVWKIF
ncbi:MAG: PSP1 domain-containing protein [Treponema sp.]